MVAQRHDVGSTTSTVIAYVSKCHHCGELHIHSFTSSTGIDKSNTSSMLSAIIPGTLIPITIPCWTARLLRDRGHQL